ncbi:hypothetical protein [Streptomyces sp. NPDC014006]|uniref:hypothetical protein n=1 Tax=Streptomyces sp. NPDC014006 TaxID=3364870 RepID=UPI0037009414
MIDWELALFGDALHDLATHLVRKGYDKDEQARMAAPWAEAMTAAGRTELTTALQNGLGTYLAFGIRAAGLPGRPATGPSGAQADPSRG